MRSERAAEAAGRAECSSSTCTISALSRKLESTFEGNECWRWRWLSPCSCRAEHLIHVYNEDGTVNATEQAAARAEIGARDFVSVDKINYKI